MKIFKRTFLTLINGAITNEGIKQTNIKVYLEGHYNGSAMNSMLTVVLPLSQPYNVSPWNYNGSESVTNMPANIIDWILVELRDAATPAQATGDTKIREQAGLLRNDGKILDMNGNDGLTFPNLTVSDNLYVVIHHRNHLSVMSSTGLTDVAGVYSYDFSTRSKAGLWKFGGSQTDRSRYFGVCAAEMETGMAK